MKLNLLGLLLLFIIASCGTRPKVIIDENKAKETTQKEVNPYQLIIGKWKMESFQVFSPNPDPTDSEEIIWEFQEDRQVIVNSMKGKTASMNTNKYWMNKSILNVNGQLYMYYFEEPLGITRMDVAKPFGDELWLDSNIDPMISPDGPKIHFTRVR